MTKKNPGSFDDRFEYAAALEEQGKFADALDRWRQLASDHKEASVFARLGTLARELGNLEEAERAFREAIQIDDKEASLYMGLGIVLMHKGENEDAAHFFRRALTLEKSQYAYSMLGAVLTRMGKEQEAIENLEAAWLC